MGNKVPRSLGEVREGLETQLRLLEKSVNRFDADDAARKDEALLMATHLRTLFCDSPQSVLTQADLKGIEMWDTTPQLINGPVQSWMGLTLVDIFGNKYIPTLDYYLSEGGVAKRLPQQDWWNLAVIRDEAGNLYTRGELIKWIANQDGGAHQDPALDEAYHRISRLNALGTLLGTAEVVAPIPGLVWVSIRQIAHEVLKSLRAEYVTPDLAKPKVAVGNLVAILKRSEHDKLIRQEGVPGDEELCPCGSGLQFRKCYDQSH